jgi:hypothetical protein
MDDLERFGDIDWTDFSTLLFPEHSISPTRDSQEHTHGVGERTLFYHKLFPYSQYQYLLNIVSDS